MDRGLDPAPIVVAGRSAAVARILTLAPDALIVPLGLLRRIELRAAPDKDESFGFTVPPAA